MGMGRTLEFPDLAFHREQGLGEQRFDPAEAGLDLAVQLPPHRCHHADMAEYYSNL